MISYGHGVSGTAHYLTWAIQWARIQTYGELHNILSGPIIHMSMPLDTADSLRLTRLLPRRMFTLTGPSCLLIDADNYLGWAQHCLRGIADCLRLAPT